MVSYCLIGCSQLIFSQQQKNIAHRDIKPSNILIGENNEVKLCDFGSAKMLVQGQKNVAYICSRYYRSPELILGAIHYTTKIDIWSLGCCICEMLINTAIFDGNNNTTLLIKIIKYLGSPTPQDLKAMKVGKQNIQKVQGSGIRTRIFKINPNASKEIIELIEKILVYNPEKRISPKEALMLSMFDAIRKEEGEKFEGLQ